MNKLKRKIISLFLIFSFAIALLESVADSIFDTLLADAQGKQTSTGLLVAIYMMTSALIFAVLAVGFTRILNRKIEIQTQIQLKQNNLLYANIAHDLKTPITSILGFAKAMQDNQVEPEQYEAVAHTIYTKAKRTDRLINQLFDYTKLEANEQPLNKKNTDICAVLRNITAVHYEEFENKGIQLEIEIPEEKIYGNIAEVEFSRAVSNLIVNAYIHNDEGSKAAVLLRKTVGSVQILIADNGRNIEAADEEQIFEPFVCGNQARTSEQGSGLGLAIAKRMIEKQEGRLYITREIAPYTKAFVVELFTQV